MLKNMNMKICMFMTLIVSVIAGFGAYYIVSTKNMADRAQNASNYIVEGEKLKKAILAHERWETNLVYSLASGSHNEMDLHSCELDALLSDYDNILKHSVQDSLINIELRNLAEKHEQIHIAVNTGIDKFNLNSPAERSELLKEIFPSLGQVSAEASPVLNRYNQAILQSQVPGDIAQSTGKTFLLLLSIIFVLVICGYIFMNFFIINPMLLIKSRIEDVSKGIFKNNYDFSGLRGDFLILGKQVDLISERCMRLADEYSDVLFQMPVHVDTKSSKAVCTNNFSTAKQQIQSVLYNLNKSLSTISSVSEDISRNVTSIKEYDGKTNSILGSSIQRLLNIQEKIVDLLEVAVNAIEELGSIQDDMSLASEKTKAVSSICANMQTMVGVVDGISAQMGVFSQKMADYFSRKGINDEELYEFVCLAEEISLSTKKQSGKFYRLLASSMQDLQIGNVGFKFLRKKFNRLLGYVNSAEINKMQFEIDSVLDEFSEIKEINLSSEQLGDEVVKQSNLIKDLAGEYILDPKRCREVNSSFAPERILDNLVETVKPSDQKEERRISENYWQNGALSKIKKVMDKTEKPRGAHNN